MHLRSNHAMAESQTRTKRESAPAAWWVRVTSSIPKGLPRPAGPSPMGVCVRSSICSAEL